MRGFAYLRARHYLRPIAALFPVSSLPSPSQTIFRFLKYPIDSKYPVRYV